jgi:hypothetical protein
MHDVTQDKGVASFGHCFEEISTDKRAPVGHAYVVDEESDTGSGLSWRWLVPRKRCAARHSMPWRGRRHGRDMILRGTLF